MPYDPNEPRDDHGRWTDSYVVEDPDKWFKDNDGKLLGDGECVSAVKHAIPTLGRTGEWAPGDAITDGSELENGTAIATFVDGKYNGHAAIYMKADVVGGKKGIWVRDQWAARKNRKAQPLHERFIAFDSKKRRQNNAGAYSVVTDGTGR